MADTGPPGEPTARPQAPPARRWAPLLPAVLVGLALRLWNLPRQILGGDELHALQALRMSLPEILTTYRESDFCQPLTAFYKLLILAGLELGEIELRSPVLVSGVLLLALAPRLASRWIEPAAAVVFGWAMALSPVLVLYSRIVRSYMPATLLSFLAAAAFYRWWESATWTPGARRWALSYAVLAAAAVYFHLGTAPFVAAPFAFAAADLLRRGLPDRETRRRWGSLALTGAVALAAVSSFVIPAWDSLRELLGSKRRALKLGGEAVARVLELQAGTAAGWLALAFWVAVVAGWVLLFRRRRSFALYTATLAAGQVAGLLVLSPVGMSVARILNRYLLILTPFVLLWLSVALARPLRGLRRSPAGFVFLALLFLGGPLADPVLRRSSFVHHNAWLTFSAPRPRLAAADVPEFYLRLAARDEPAPIVEFPWPQAWNVGHIFPLYQEHHRQEVLVSMAALPFLREGLDLRRLLLSNPETYLASPARYLVVHTSYRAEETDRARRAGVEREWAPSGVLDQLDEAGPSMAQRAARAWGPAVYEDAWISVWDLDAVRERKGR